MNRQVHICEVGPRDGLQNAKNLMPTEAKKAWIRALAAAGLEEIEVGSFVPPKLIPAMADTGEIVAFARTLPNVKVVALAPNLKGFQRALEAGAHKVTFPISASRQHSESNVRMTPEQMVEEVRKCAQYPHPGVELEGAVSTAFGCTMQGDVPEDDVVRIASQLGGVLRCSGPRGHRRLRQSGPGETAVQQGEEQNRQQAGRRPISTTRAASAWRTRLPPTKKACAISTARWAGSAAARSRPARAAT